VAHLVIALYHGVAHRELGVDLSIWQRIYAALVIFAAPLAAGVLLWTPRRAKA